MGIHREERELSSYSKALQVVVVCCTTPYTIVHYSAIRFKSVFVEFFKGPRKLCVDFANVHNHSFYPISMK